MILREDFIVTTNDLRIFKVRNGGCVYGWKTFCSKHNLDWFSFIRSGISAQALLDTKDAMAEQFILFCLENRK